MAAHGFFRCEVRAVPSGPLALAREAPWRAVHDLAHRPLTRRSHRRFVQCGEIAPGAWPWVQSVAGVFDRAVGERTELIALHARGTERLGQANLAPQLTQAVRKRARRRLRAEGTSCLGEARLRNGAIELDDRGQAQRVGEPVMQRADV